jgi:hypothetical protein
MHKEILSKAQLESLDILRAFSPEFGLVGGTAIALQIGHRESIDFDLFSMEAFDNTAIKRKIEKIVKIEKVIIDKEVEYTCLAGGVMLTFHHYPFHLEFSYDFEEVIKMPNLLTLAAMKAYALARRAKWKDYVDLYFIIRDHHTLEEIIQKTKDIFGSEFNANIFLSQLSYFEDINYSEQIVYRKGFEVSDEQVKNALVEYSLL